jgi:hypothetical protein
MRATPSSGCSSRAFTTHVASSEENQPKTGKVRQALPSADPEAMATALWGLVHGLAFLHLDGKFDTSSADAVAQKVRTSVRVMLAASDQSRLHRASKARQ